MGFPGLLSQALQRKVSEMKRIRLAQAAAIMASLSMAGCASILSDSKPQVSLHSIPQTTSFTITDSAGQVVQAGNTPSQVVLETSKGYFQRETYTVTFHREGHQDDVHVLRPTVSGWYWGNILLGGLIGMLIVDPLTGAMYTLPDDVTGRPTPLAPQDTAA